MLARVACAFVSQKRVNPRLWGLIGSTLRDVAQRWRAGEQQEQQTRMASQASSELHTSHIGAQSTSIAPSAAVCATTVEPSRCPGKTEDLMVRELVEQCVIGTEQATNEANTDVLCEADTQQEGLQREDMQLLLSPRLFQIK